MFNKSQHHELMAAILIAAVLISSSLVFLGIRIGDTDSVKTAVIDALTDFVVNGPSEDDIKKAEDKAKAEAAEDESALKTEPIDMSDVIGDDAMEGDSDAPVTIVEFSDYQCPYCLKFIDETYGQIKKNYIDTGKVRLVFRDFPLDGHSRAMPAANAAECVREQSGDEGYFQMHDMIWEGHNVDGASALSDETLKDYAASIVPDYDQFVECYDTGKYTEEALADIKDGQKYGISGTPSFLINGELVKGAQPYSVFERIIEEKLAE